MENRFVSMSHFFRAVLDDMNKCRHASMSSVMLKGLDLGLLLAVLSVFITGEYLLTGFIATTLGIVLVIAYEKCRKREAFHQRVIPELAAALGKSTSYQIEGGMSLLDIHESHLYGMHDREHIQSGDCLSGVKGDTGFRFCDSRYFYTQQNEDGSIQKCTLFKGLTFQADFSRNFEGCTILGTHTPEGVDASFTRILTGNECFDRFFQVYSTNDSATTKILTATMQSLLIQLVESIRKEDEKDDVLVSFHRNKLYVMQSSSKERFEAKILTPLNMKHMYDDLEVMNAMIGLVEELN